ncbi:hypothetical protein FBU30_000751 [Linnemannia zychae]|nr:hypothetical protein FBU30_000751 [Linnemannia zychae]
MKQAQSLHRALKKQINNALPLHDISDALLLTMYFNIGLASHELWDLRKDDIFPSNENTDDNSEHNSDDDTNGDIDNDIDDSADDVTDDSTDGDDIDDGIIDGAIN